MGEVVGHLLLLAASLGLWAGRGCFIKMSGMLLFQRLVHQSLI